MRYPAFTRLLLVSFTTFWWDTSNYDTKAVLSTCRADLHFAAHARIDTSMIFAYDMPPPEREASSVRHGTSRLAPGSTLTADQAWRLFRRSVALCLPRLDCSSLKRHVPESRIFVPDSWLWLRICRIR
ncbi:hypothetical protein PENANT_c033G07181 [Penicillium antarcticum]|uniref:Secreted protein n=1 Tax=Penicillium antarcticum TaxID=416450 RepID=A0A1V6PUP7_9EURO|nr:hypothetical protein PENANT_c033G07181 [Penicillium antarcticum]